MSSGSWIIIANNVNIPSYKFKFSSFVSLPAVVVNCHPSSHISFLLFRTQNNRIVSLPLEACGPVGDLAVGCDRFRAEDLPVEGGNGVETGGQGGEGHSFDILIHLYSSAGLEDEASAVAKEGAVDSVGILSQFDKNFYFFVDEFLEDGLSVD